MALEFCDKCKSMHYRTDACRVKKWAEVRKDTPNRSDVVGCAPTVVESGELIVRAGIDTRPADILPRKPRQTDRHKPGYQAAKQREYRARKKDASGK